MNLEFVEYKNETQLADITLLIEKDLSEPYSIFTYRYFINQWPDLCLLALKDSCIIGVIVCKLERHKSGKMRGYVAMLSVDKLYRGQGIGSELVKRVCDKMKQQGAQEIVLETEYTNHGALRLYEGLGFIREKRLVSYYLNGVDAFRLKLILS